MEERKKNFLAQPLLWQYMLQIFADHLKMLSNTFQQMFVRVLKVPQNLFKILQSLAVFCSCDRNFQVMEKQTSEDTEEAHKFKSQQV